MENKKIIKPLSFEATQSGGTGRKDAIAPISFGYRVVDDRLAGMEIPIGMDPEGYQAGYLAGYERVIKDVPRETSGRTQNESRIQNEGKIVAFRQNHELLTGAKVANFEAIPVMRERWLDRDGKEHTDFEEFLTEVRINGKITGKMVIPTSKISSLPKLVKKRFSTAMVSFDEPNAEKIIEAEFRERTTQIPEVIVLYEQGWQFVDGRMRFIHDDAVEMPGFRIQTGFSLPWYREWKRNEVVQTLLHIFRLSEDKNMLWPLVLFSLLGLLFKPFQLAGFDIHFLLFVNGKTGAMKTSVSRVLFTQLCRKSDRNKVRRMDADTQVSMERAIVNGGCDTVMLFDDYAPAKTPQKKAEMQDKLEALIRQVGDGATKSRSSGKLEDIQGEGVKGVVAVTGELKGKGASSNLRCMYCELRRGSVDTEILTWLQQNDRAFTTVLHHFSEFISLNWVLVIRKISTEMESCRRKYRDMLNEKRVIDMAATLAVTADIFRDFLVNYCEWDLAMIEGIYEEINQAIMETAVQNESMSRMESYSSMFLKAVNALMATNKISLYREGKMQSEQIGTFDGFCDDKYYYFLPEITYAKAINFMTQMRQYLPLDLRELMGELYADGIIKVYSNGGGKRTFYARLSVGNGKKQGFIKISREIFEQIISEDHWDKDCFGTEAVKEEMYDV